MNIHKNMEVIFVALLAAVALGSFLLEYLPEAQARLPIPIAQHIATPTSMAVVIIRAPHALAGD